MFKTCMALCRKHREILLYLVFGVLTTLVNILVYLLLRQLVPQGSVGMGISNFLAWVAAVLFAYCTNRTYVFRSGADTPVAKRRELAAFITARVFSLLVDTAMLYGIVLLLRWDDRLAKVLSNIVVIAINYVLSKFIIFNSNKTAPSEDN